MGMWLPNGASPAILSMACVACNPQGLLCSPPRLCCMHVLHLPAPGCRACPGMACTWACLLDRAGGSAFRLTVAVVVADDLWRPLVLHYRPASTHHHHRPAGTHQHQHPASSHHHCPAGRTTCQKLCSSIPVIPSKAPALMRGIKAPSQHAAKAT